MIKKILTSLVLLSLICVVLVGAQTSGQSTTSIGSTSTQVWEDDGITLMRNPIERTYGCFGCNEELCVDPVPEMIQADETADRYCSNNFEVVESLQFQFNTITRNKVVTDYGRPYEGYEPFMFLLVFPGIEEVDFDNVVAFEGIYSFDGNLTFISNPLPVTTAAKSIMDEGMETFLDNLEARLQIAVVDSNSLNELIARLNSDSPTATGTSSTQTCQVGCICKGGTTTCPNEQQPTITTEIETTSIGGTSSKDTSGTSTQEETSTTSTISISKTGTGGTSIKSGEVEIVTSEKVSVTNSKLTMQTSSGSTKEIKVMPEQVSIILGTSSIETNELKAEDEKAVYSVTGTKKGKIIAVFPVEMKISAKVDAETGSVVSIEKPWWSFLAKEE